VFLTATLVLTFVSLIAALAPALRAARVDPMRTLREQ
jgi:ABC-type lipoprotein release transport system permease subunit